MLFDHKKLKRQIELLGLCVNKNRDKITVLDLSVIFNVGEATIERDLNDLRSRGISIHSQSGLGVIVKNETCESLLKNELLNYFGICYTSSYEDLIINDFQRYPIKRPLEVFVIIQRAIDRTQKVKIKFVNEVISSVEPRLIIRKNKEWHLVCQNNSKIEYYKLASIIGVKAQNEYFNKVIKEVDLNRQVEKHFNTQISKSYDVKLSFKVPINGNIPTQLLTAKMLSKDSKGRDVLQAECNNIDELVTWIFSNSGSVFVIEPKELRERIILIAEMIVKNQKSIDDEVIFPEETAQEEATENSNISFSVGRKNETYDSVEPRRTNDEIQHKERFSMGDYTDETDESIGKDLLSENIESLWSEFYSEGSIYSIDEDFEESLIGKYYKPDKSGYKDFEIEFRIAI